MDDTTLRQAVAVATGSVISPLPSADELVPLVMRLAREHGELTLTVNLEREKTRNLKRQVAELQETIRANR